MATPQCSPPMTGICDEEASYHRSTIAVLQPRYQATPILQQSVGGDRSDGLHFSSLLGVKPTSVETPKNNVSDPTQTLMLFGSSFVSRPHGSKELSAAVHGSLWLITTNNGAAL